MTNGNDIDSRPSRGPEPMDQVEILSIDSNTRTSQQLEQLMLIYERGYQGVWIGKERYKTKTLPNVSSHHILVINGQPAAAVDMNRDRIISIAVDPDYRGKGLGAEILKRVAEIKPEAWISVGLDAQAMLATILNSDLNYSLIENPTEIEKLFKSIKGIPENFTITTGSVTNELLTERFREKGIEKKEFLVFYRPGSIHSETYQQLVFQNKPK